MKKRFKKIYIEITNKCNLNCSFCSNDFRTLKEMSPQEFEVVINKIKDYTDYIYLHIKGEPLIHTHFDEILSICDLYKIKVNITTNGTLLKTRLDILNKHDCIRQLNVSLHSENNEIDYFENVFSVCNFLSTKMFISYRLWTLSNYKLDKKSTNIVDKIVSYYNLSIDAVEKLKNDSNIKIVNNIFVNKENLFIWPNVDNNYNISGKCYGLITHIGILSNGTVVPCCLDSSGVINLGNIFEEDLSSILNKEIVKEMINGFKAGKSIHVLCKNCNFRSRFVK